MPGKGLEMKKLITCLTVCVLGCAAIAQTPVNEDYKLLASDGASEDYFGTSVAVDGDTVVVGRPGRLIKSNN